MLIRKPNTLDGDERAVLLIPCGDDPPNAPGCCGLRKISNAKTSKVPAVTEEKFVPLTRESIMAMRRQYSALNKWLNIRPITQVSRRKTQERCGLKTASGDFMFLTKSNWMFLLMLLVFASTFAHATYPGKNGRIVFTQGPDIWTMNPDGSDVRPLTSFGSSGKAACCASWSADGKTLVFAAADSSTDPAQIWMMNADGSNRHQVLNDPEFVDNDPSLSPDGTTIAFDRCPLNSSGCELFQVRVDGAGLKALIPFGPNTDIFDVTPEYSPDGNTIAFSGFNRAGLIAAAFLMDADGSHIRPITPPGLEAFLPDWAPDGNTIAFTTRANYPPNTFTPQVWIMNKDGSGLRQFTFPGSSNDFWPAWSPQGDAIAFERDNADFSQFVIFVKNLAASGSLEQPLRQGTSAALMKRTPPHLVMPGRAPLRGNAAKLINQNGAIPRWGSAPE